MVEQVNLTVRTRPDDKQYESDTNLNGHKTNTMSMNILNLAHEKLILLVTLVAIISFIFIVLTLTYGIYKIRAVLEIRKGMLRALHSIALILLKFALKVHSNHSDVFSYIVTKMCFSRTLFFHCCLETGKLLWPASCSKT